MIDSVFATITPEVEFCVIKTIVQVANGCNSVGQMEDLMKTRDEEILNDAVIEKFVQSLFTNCIIGAPCEGFGRLYTHQRRC
jgi:hypothetical protein